MKYFTPEWYYGELPDEEEMTTFPRYNEHIARLLPQLPNSLQVLATQVRLHDGSIQRMILNREAAALDLEMREGCNDLKPKENFDMNLHYRHIVLSPSGIDVLQSVARDPKAESLYDEVDIEQVEGEEPMYIHRISFWSTGDDGRRAAYKHVTIQFKELDLVRTLRKAQL